MAPGPPPSTFTTPALDPSLSGTTVYLAVVQTELTCPVSQNRFYDYYSSTHGYYQPDGHTEYGLSSVGLVVA